jgi:hypothetical protein
MAQFQARVQPPPADLIGRWWLRRAAASPETGNKHLHWQELEGSQQQCLTQAKAIKVQIRVHEQ